MPTVNHLLFDDDSIIFRRVDLSNIEAIKEVLARYKKASGQAINFQKSVVTFSPNVAPDQQGTILTSLGPPH